MIGFRSIRSEKFIFSFPRGHLFCQLLDLILNLAHINIRVFSFELVLIKFTRAILVVICEDGISHKLLVLVFYDLGNWVLVLSNFQLAVSILVNLLDIVKNLTHACDRILGLDLLST